MAPLRKYLWAGALVAIFVGGFFALPTVLMWEQGLHGQEQLPPFTVGVDPKSKTITEAPGVDELFQSHTGVAAVIESIGNGINDIAGGIAATAVYQRVIVPKTYFIVVDPGFRKEQAAAAFATALKWDKTTALGAGITEGTISPGTYIVSNASSTADIREMIAERFTSEVRDRYSTSTEAVVPMDDALTIASMLERETSNAYEMRIISGIIWNRIFAGMKLQIDATVQYAKGSEKKGWWPALTSNDKYIESPYNTYVHTGIPPGPISNPSVVAVIAALNPKKTSCLFYFHDKLGGFHCSDTYEEHITLLKKYYGRGK